MAPGLDTNTWLPALTLGRLGFLDFGSTLIHIEAVKKEEHVMINPVSENDDTGLLYHGTIPDLRQRFGKPRMAEGKLIEAVARTRSNRG